MDWPYAAQVFKIERHVRRVGSDAISQQVRYGLTSLKRQEASPQRLLQLIHTHWQIENGLHYRRDDTLREDRCTLRIGHAPQLIAAINNLVLGILHRLGWHNIPDARRHCNANFYTGTQLVFQRLH